MITIVPELIGDLSGRSYVAALAAFLFVTLSLGGSHETCQKIDCRRRMLINLHPLSLSPLDKTIQLASGLLWVSELIEEHTKIAKVLGKKCIYVRPSDHPEIGAPPPTARRSSYVCANTN